MTTLPQDDLPKDVGILRAAAQHNRANVGSMPRYCRAAKSAEVIPSVWNNSGFSAYPAGKYKRTRDGFRFYPCDAGSAIPQWAVIG